MATMTISRVRVMTVAVWITVAFFILGIFAGALYTASFAYYRQISGTVIFWYLLLTPFLYAVVGLITALIISFLYNHLNGVFGSIGLEVDDSTMSVALPPLPPTRWASTSVRRR